MEWVIDSGCVGKGHDVADALVIRAPIDYEAGIQVVEDHPTTAGIVTKEQYRQAVEKQVHAIVDAALGDDDE